MALASIFAAALSLFGCGGKAPVEITAEDITSVSIGYSHMARASAYHFSLKEQNGEALFSCHYFFYDTEDWYEVTVEEAQVEAGYMDELRALAAEYGFLNMKYKEPGLFDRQISDAPSYTLELGWPIIKNDRTYSDYLYLNYHPTGSDEVKTLFQELAKQFEDNAAVLFQ